jgi:uncharacterized cysteine cluster protein YcgN (CxxCxxCC family)
MQAIDELHTCVRLEPRPLSAAIFLPQFCGFVRNKETAVSMVHHHHRPELVDVQKGKDFLLDVIALNS